MLLWLLGYLNGVLPNALAAWEKITPRAALAAGLSFAVALLLGPQWIGWLRRRFREPIKSDSPELVRLHGDKQSTPTMGGLFVVAALVASVLLFGDLGNRYLAAAMVVAVGLALVGIVDDLVKIRSAAKGLAARHKLIAQLLVAAAAALLLYRQQAAVPDGLLLRLPLAGTSFSLGLWFIPSAIVVIVGASNAVNLADGLDGLAGGCLIAATAAMTGLVYAAGHAGWAAYLGVPRIPHAGEMTVLGGAHNRRPPRFPLVQLSSRSSLYGQHRRTAAGRPAGRAGAGRPARTPASGRRRRVRGRGGKRDRPGRILQVAPPAAPALRRLHHHFQFLGWPENKIVVRFWIASALCALLGAASLKLNVPDAEPSFPRSAWERASGDALRPGGGNEVSPLPIATTRHAERPSARYNAERCNEDEVVR